MNVISKERTTFIVQCGCYQIINTGMFAVSSHDEYVCDLKVHGYFGLQL